MRCVWDTEYWGRQQNRAGYTTNIPAEETITTNHYEVLVQSQMTEIGLNNVRWNNNSWLE